jgi:hypothetical protein
MPVPVRVDCLQEGKLCPDGFPSAGGPYQKHKGLKVKVLEVTL